MLRFPCYEVFQFPWILGWTAAKLQKPASHHPTTPVSVPPHSAHINPPHPPAECPSTSRNGWDKEPNRRETGKGRARERLCLLVGLNSVCYCTAQNRPSRTCPKNGQKTAFVVAGPQLSSDWTPSSALEGIKAKRFSTFSTVLCPPVTILQPCCNHAQLFLFTWDITVEINRTVTKAVNPLYNTTTSIFKALLLSLKHNFYFSKCNFYFNSMNISIIHLQSFKCIPTWCFLQLKHSGVKYHYTLHENLTHIHNSWIQTLITLHSLNWIGRFPIISKMAVHTKPWTNTS